MSGGCAIPVTTPASRQTARRPRARIRSVDLGVTGEGLSAVDLRAAVADIDPAVAAQPETASRQFAEPFARP